MLEFDKTSVTLASSHLWLGMPAGRHGAAEEPVFKLTSAISSFVFNPAPYRELAIVIDVTAAVKTNRRTF